jgi:hypothetical protein
LYAHMNNKTIKKREKKKADALDTIAQTLMNLQG